MAILSVYMQFLEVLNTMCRVKYTLHTHYVT